MQTVPTGQKITSKEMALVSHIGRERDLDSKGMKRKNNIYQKICTIENLRRADEIARKGKRHQYGVKLFDRNKEPNLQLLHVLLKTKTYKTSAYNTFMINDPKEREIFCLPYFPDRIAHHAAMLQLEKIFIANFTADTYSCIKNKGIHAASNALSKALLNAEETRYYLKLDIRKFYPSIDHDILKQLLRKRFKDRDLLMFLDEIIDSAPGVPIGNYLSQYFANFYLSEFDHWIKEKLRVKHYFRYADDIIIPASNKEYLHKLLFEIRNYLEKNLKLQVKGNYKVSPVDPQGIDFVGYKHFHGYKKVRPRIKKRCFRMLVKRPNRASLSSYMGWFKHSKSRNLVKKITHEQVQRLRN